MIFSLLPTIYKDSNNPFNFKTHVSFRNISKNCFGDNVSTKSLSIYISKASNSVNKLASTKKNDIHCIFKGLWIAFSSKQAAGVSWERSNGAGEGEKELAFHSCVHATSSKTAKLLQLAGTQLCFLLEEDPFNEF